MNTALTGGDKTAAEAIQNALTPETVTGDGVSAAANSVANQNTVTANDEVLAKLNAAIGQGGTQATDQNTTIVVQPYMDIAIEDVDTQAQTVTLEITPMSVSYTHLDVYKRQRQHIFRHRRHPRGPS